MHSLTDDRYSQFSKYTISKFTFIFTVHPYAAHLQMHGSLAYFQTEAGLAFITVISLCSLPQEILREERLHFGLKNP